MPFVNVKVVKGQINAEMEKQIIKNSPKHPSFCTPDWVKEDFKRDVIYFIYELNNKPLGCVAFEMPETGTSYLNRLSVIPSARNTGIGKKLVLHHLNYSKKKNINKTSIGIIAHHSELKEWYKQIGFQEGETVRFKHLPFEVCYMSYQIQEFQQCKLTRTGKSCIEPLVIPAQR